MEWVYYILIGGTLNAINNLGYKMMAGKDIVLLATAAVFALASLILFSYVYLFKIARLSDLAVGNIPWIILAMGLMTPLVMVFVVKAFATGPISLIDPLWACIYSLVSVAIGLIIVRENPSLLALSGIAFYLVGAYLMSRG